MTIRSLAKEMKDLGKGQEDWLLTSILLNGLEGKHKDFVHRTIVALDKDPNFDDVVQMLFEDARLLKREQTASAMAAALKKAQKGNNNNKDKDTKKGEELPEYHKCLKKKNGDFKHHRPEDCFTDNPEKKEEYFKKLNKKKENNKGGKANAAKKDDDDKEESIPKYTMMAIASDGALSHLRHQSLLDVDEIVSPEDLASQAIELVTLCSEIAGEDSPEYAQETVVFPESSPAIGLLGHETSKLFTSYMASKSKPPDRSTEWIMDSGCTHHMYHDSKDFKTYKEYSAPITIANGTVIRTKGKGKIELELLLPNGNINAVDIVDVLHVPDLACGLFSIGQATDRDIQIVFMKDVCQIIKDGKQIGVASKIINTFNLSVTHSKDSIDYYIDIAMQAMAATYSPEALEIWHRRMGHLNEADLKRLAGMSNGMSLNTKVSMKPICGPCERGKSSRKVSRRVQKEVLEKLAKVDTDLGGPIDTAGVGGHHHWMLITDRATGLTWSFTFKIKDEAFGLFADWLIQAENQSGCRLKAVRIDNGTEYVNHKFDELFKKKGIIVEPTVAYTPEQNGLSEVQNRIVLYGVRAMLFDAKLTKYVWNELLRTKVYLKNRSPTTRLPGKTPYELWTGLVPDLNHLHIIGSTAWCHIPKEKRKKLDERSKKCYLVGYEASNIYRVYNPTTRKVERATHVRFDETALANSSSTEDPGWLSDLLDRDYNVLDEGGEQERSSMTPVMETGTAGVPQISHNYHHQAVGDQSDDDHQHPPGTAEEPESLDLSDPVGADVEDTNLQEEPVEEVLPDGPEAHPDPSTDATYTSGGRPTRTRVPTQKVADNEKQSTVQNWATKAILASKSDATVQSERMYCRQAVANGIEVVTHHEFDPDYDLDAVVDCITAIKTFNAQVDVIDYEPLTYQQAMGGPFASQWKAAMDKEYNSFMYMKTWELVKKPADALVLRGKWIYKIKSKSDGSTVYKARWVIRGFEQQYGVNFDETFASVVKNMTFKTLFAVIAHHDLDCEQMDVVTAFLNSYLKELIYVEQPHGYQKKGKNSSSLVCLLIRALYGLKQAPRAWYFTIRTYLESKGFNHSEADHSLFINRLTKLIVSLYVDDIKIVGPKGSKHIMQLKKDLSKEYRMTDLGPISDYLGMEVSRDRANKQLTIVQTKYITKVLTRFGMGDCASAPTPMVAGTKLRKETILTASEDQRLLYQSMIGSLMYAMIETRPDIAFSVSVLSRFSQNPNETHMKAAKRVLRYLKGTKHLGITYGTGHDVLIGYTDADWATDEETRLSVGGYIFSLYGGAITWSSKRQLSVALSSCEAEYMAQTQASKEALWLTRLLKELDLELGLPKPPVIIRADNQGAIALTKDPKYHSRTKHIDIQWHFVRDQVECGAIRFHWIETIRMAADGLTKALEKSKFERFVALIDMRNGGK